MAYLCHTNKNFSVWEILLFLLTLLDGNVNYQWVRVSFWGLGSLAEIAQVWFLICSGKEITLKLWSSMTITKQD